VVNEKLRYGSLGLLPTWRLLKTHGVAYYCYQIDRNCIARLGNRTPVTLPHYTTTSNSYVWDSVLIFIFEKYLAEVESSGPSGCITTTKSRPCSRHGGTWSPQSESVGYTLHTYSTYISPLSPALYIPFHYHAHYYQPVSHTSRARSLGCSASCSQPNQA